jgi:hypothetical protein
MPYTEIPISLALPPFNAKPLLFGLNSNIFSLPRLLLKEPHELEKPNVCLELFPAWVVG